MTRHDYERMVKDAEKKECECGLLKKLDGRERLENAMNVDDVLMPMYMYE